MDREYQEMKKYESLTEEEKEIYSYGCKREDIDAYIEKELSNEYYTLHNHQKASEIGMFVMSVLSDCQETQNKRQRDQWLNKAKYVLSKWMMRDCLYLADILPSESEARFRDANRQGKKTNQPRAIYK